MSMKSQNNKRINKISPNDDKLKIKDFQEIKQINPNDKPKAPDIKTETDQHVEYQEIHQDNHNQHVENANDHSKNNGNQTQQQSEFNSNASHDTKQNRNSNDHKNDDLPKNSKTSPETNVLDYKKLYEEQRTVLEKMRFALENERKQLVSKLEEKSKIAQLKINEKITELEVGKKLEMDKMKAVIAEDMVLAFLDPILLFESTVNNAPENNPAVTAYIQGYSMIINMFKEQLDHLGVEQIDVKPGDMFNENFMSAFDVESNPEFKTDQVIKIVSKGFVLNKKIIKYVSVVVAK